MSSDDHTALQVRAVSPESRPAALQLAFACLGEEDRRRQIESIASASAVGGSPWDGLFGAYRGDKLVGSILTQVQAGKCAQVWPPSLDSDEDRPIAVSLLRTVVEWLDRRPVHMAQILTEAITAEAERTLCKGGFDYLTDLLYLVCQKEDFPPSNSPSPLQFEPYDPQSHARLADIVGATYQHTLDCPKLNDVRQLDDVLDGYMATGESSSDRWLIVRHQNRDVGCLLLADHPRFENMELVYMGVIPAHRGRHWGADIARHAQSIAGETGRPRLVLAVDASNDPAINMYASVGFRAWDRRRVYYHVFSR